MFTVNFMQEREDGITVSIERRDESEGTVQHTTFDVNADGEIFMPERNSVWTWLSDELRAVAQIADNYAKFNLLPRVRTHI